MTVRQRMKCAAWALVVVLVSSAAAAAQDVARMERAVQDRASAIPPFMGAVLVAQADRVLLDKGYGFANLEWQVPASSSARFRIGSVTKQFTAAIVLRLEERGRLSLAESPGTCRTFPTPGRRSRSSTC